MQSNIEHFARFDKTVPSMDWLIGHRPWNSVISASSIEIEVTGEIASGPQISGVTVNFIPKRASRSAWVSFSGGEIPRGLSARILGYEDL